MKMGKVQKNLSLLKRSNNRTTIRPPSTEKSESENEAENDVNETDKRGKRFGNRRVQKESNGECTWENLRGKLFIPSCHRDLDWRLPIGTIFKVLFSIRVATSFWSIISDCDEVYNYWEPLHLLLYGRGFQTWEYSPTYAIRSWLYIHLHKFPVQFILPLFSSSKIFIFHTIRFIIGFLTIGSEVLLYQSVCLRLSNSIGRLFIVFSIFSVAMFNSSCAFLPSSFSMSMNAFAMAFYLREKWFLAVLCTAVSALVGWPFAAILGLPIVLEMLVLRAKALALRFIVYSAVSALFLLTLLCLVDSYYYGKTVIAPLNIVLYNVFTSHGSELYGVEPASFYVKNLLLNFNVVVPLAFVSLPLALHLYIRNSLTIDEKDNVVASKISFSLAYWYRFVPVLLVYLTTFLWLIIFFFQAHKEERFLFPIFPLLSLLAAVGLDSISRLLPPKFTIFALSFFLIVFLTFSTSRCYALHRNYSGMLETYKSFHEHLLFNQRQLDFVEMQNPIRLCLGKEWYRFHSSFFLPESAVDKEGRERSVEMHFLRSEFRGLLPKLFSTGRIPDITREVPTEMNDLNREELSRYVHVETCDYLIDLDGPNSTELEPNYAGMENQFRSISQKPFLLAAESHPIYRAFYIPFSSRHLKFGQMRVLERLRAEQRQQKDNSE